MTIQEVLKPYEGSSCSVQSVSLGGACQLKIGKGLFTEQKTIDQVNEDHVIIVGRSRTLYPYTTFQRISLPD